MDRAGLRRVQRDLFCVRSCGWGRAVGRLCERPCRSLGRGVGSSARGPRRGGAIAHIKWSCCRGAISATVPETHAVTPVTRFPACWSRHPCAKGDVSSSRAAWQGCWERRPSGGGSALLLEALLTLRRRLWGGRVQRQSQQPVADRAVARPVAVRRRGRQMRAEQGPRLVPDRCRHTPPPGTARRTCPVSEVPRECDAVKAARGR